MDLHDLSDEGVAPLRTVPRPDVVVPDGEGKKYGRTLKQLNVVLRHDEIAVDTISGKRIVDVRVEHVLDLVGRGFTASWDVLQFEFILGVCPRLD